jgi:tetrapyrrole methylase family protein/MazG family protein
MIPYEMKERYNIDDLAEIVMLLRSKDGCPWDKEQTHKSIRNDLIEETYEVIEAIDQNDPVLLQEELGDLLLQVVFHTQIEQEQQHFTLEDVCTDICKKMIIRHPHVFSTVQADTTEEVLNNWDAIKAETKHQTTYTETQESVAKTLPALMRGQKVYKRASKAQKTQPACNESVLAHVTECKHALEQAMYMEEEQDMAYALGDLLFCCTATAQQLGIDAEQTLTDATNRFVKSFGVMEEACTRSGRTIETLSTTEQKTLWEKAKCVLQEEEESTHAAR